jgi:site-specific recombinase XerC
VKTIEGLDAVLGGKRMSERSKSNFKSAFGSLAKVHEELPTKPVEINRWLVSLKGYADQTVRLWFTCLRSGFSYLEVNYELPNPLKGMDAPKVQKKRRRYLRADEIVKVIRACKGDYEGALVMTLVDSGCRVGGLPKLKGSDVGNGWLNLTEKTGERRYRLDSRICELLKRLAGSDSGLVFGTSSSALSMRVIRICRRAGLKGAKLGAHTLRHSSASLVASDTKNVLAVKALLQHDNIQTSMVYIHDVEEELLKGISPLQLVADRVKDSGYEQKQLPMEGSADNVEVVSEDDGVLKMVSGEYVEIGDGVSVRPLLKTEDLRLLREIMIGYAMNNIGDAVSQRGSELLRRMVRKVK